MFRQLTLSLLTLLILAPVAASARVETTNPDMLRIEYQPGDDMPTLRCSVLRHCIVTFPVGVELHDYIIADGARWIVDAGVSGVSPYTYWLAIKPRYCGISTLLTVPSRLELTHILLRSLECENQEDLGPGDQLTILDPGLSEELPVPPLPPPPEPEPEAVQEVQPRPRVPEKILFAQPNRRLRAREVLVYHDGRKTYVQFPDVPQVLPTVAKRGKKGKPEVALNSRLVGNVLIVDEVLEEGFLLDDAQHRVPFSFHARPRGPFKFLRFFKGK